MQTEVMQRGTLRVYLGASPGVGKTFAMLDEGQRRAGRGTDVVVGLVETHDRPHTQDQIADLEVIPRRTLHYRDTVQTEMDLPAILARKPGVALVDELAHTNIPGTEHEKRWQDIEELLDAGISVITTVNIQHLESLNDVVESITGTRQRETVPDKVVRQADAIELVDMSPHSLRRRMAHGNIYAADKVDAALSRYFREGNLSALRELALLWLADRVDEGLELYRDQHDIDSTWATRERIVAAVTGGPESAVLMRRAARIASRIGGGEWLALLITRRDGLVGIAPGQLHGLQSMAENMGGTFHTVVGDDVATAILDFARAENASQILIGASRRGRISTILRPGIGEFVIAESGDVDIHIVTHDEARKNKNKVRAASTLGNRRRVAGFAMGVLGPFLLSMLLLVTPDFHGLPTEAMLFMALVVTTALIGGLWPAVAAALLSGVVLNFFFTPPLRTLTIADPENAFAIAMFIVVGIAVASVVDLAARRTAQAQKARAEADALAVLSHSLLHAGDDFPELLASACELFGMRGAAVLAIHGEAAPGDSFSGTSFSNTVVLVEHGAAPHTVADADVSVAIDDKTMLALSGRKLPAADQRLLRAYAAHASVIGERHRAAAESAERQALAEGDKTRTALLAAVSHDLRSPLAAVKAAVSSLRNNDIDWSAEDEETLLATIEESSDRLDALVSNLLDMSRLYMGTLKPHVEELDLTSVVHHSVSALPGGERVDIRIGENVPVIAGDAGLLDRVVANLVENAIKHATPDAHVRVDASVADSRVVLRVIDNGAGIPAASREQMFEPFQRLGDVPKGDGIGLGLAVARGLTEAMGGTLSAEDTPGGGLTFVLDMPIAREPL